MAKVAVDIQWACIGLLGCRCCGGRDRPPHGRGLDLPCYRRSQREGTLDGWPSSKHGLVAYNNPVQTLVQELGVSGTTRALGWAEVAVGRGKGPPVAADTKRWLRHGIPASQRARALKCIRILAILSMEAGVDGRLATAPWDDGR